MLKYRFTTQKNEKRVIVEKPFEMLSDLSNCSISDIDDAADSLQRLINDQIEYNSWGASEYCVIDSSEIESMITYDFGEKETVIDTKELLQLIIDYKNYIKTGK